MKKHLLAEYKIQIVHESDVDEDQIDSAIDALENGNADDKVRFIGEQITDLVRQAVPDAELVVTP